MLPGLVGLVMSEAFAGKSIFGGMLGAMMVGFQRAAFSSEAGLGSSAIAHSAAQTDRARTRGLRRLARAVHRHHRDLLPHRA